MQKLKVEVQKLAGFKGELPTYGSALASGFDLRAQLEKPLLVRPGERVMVNTALAFAVPAGFELQIRPRSGWAAKKGITVINSPGTVDADYRGEVKIALINLSQEVVEIIDQDRIAQGVLCPVFMAELELKEQLSLTERGAGGFGSTGLNGGLSQI